MVRVGIIGATGYTALELLKLLLRHPDVEITCLTSRSEDRPALGTVHPELRGRLNLELEPLQIESFRQRVDCVFSCLPHAASAEIVRDLVSDELKVVDFSADYRLNDVQTFESWYGVAHPDPDRVGHVAYGIPELFREQIRSANLTANPGCFPSSALLPLAPLFKEQLIQPQSVIVDSKTGVSGAGRKPNLRFHYPECNESISAYGVGTHRHMPEINQIIQRYCNENIEAVFTPHLTPMDRGILSTLYLRPQQGVTLEEIESALTSFYRDETFVRISPDLPATKHVSGTNFCDIAVRQCNDTIIILSALDNLVKGASGAAVQNFNLMYGFDETTALL